MTPEELIKLQRTELEILKRFDTYCKNNRLLYYLIGGALLGAARYHGFIPWDDDIDVAMPRDDYERLKKEWASNPIPDLFLQSAETDPHFSRCIMKLRLDGTHITEQNAQNVKMHDGIYIDVFPIDYLSDADPEIIDARSKAIRRYMTLRSIKNGYTIGGHQRLKKIIRRLSFIISCREIDKRIDKLCMKENAKEHKYAILYLHNYDWKHQIHAIDVFGEGSPCLFEGRSFNAPQKTDVFLSKVFGNDYMKEPDESKRVLSHKYINLEFPPDIDNSITNA